MRDSPKQTFEDTQAVLGNVNRRREPVHTLSWHHPTPHPLPPPPSFCQPGMFKKKNGCKDELSTTRWLCNRLLRAKHTSREHLTSVKHRGNAFFSKVTLHGAYQWLTHGRVLQTHFNKSNGCHVELLFVVYTFCHVQKKQWLVLSVRDPRH